MFFYQYELYTIRLLDQENDNKKKIIILDWILCSILDSIEKWWWGKFLSFFIAWYQIGWFNLKHWIFLKNFVFSYRDETKLEFFQFFFVSNLLSWNSMEKKWSSNDDHTLSIDKSVIHRHHIFSYKNRDNI